jgi:hypothetical protein
MLADSRRKIEMGVRVLEFSEAHPDTEPAMTATVARLKLLLSRAKTAATLQRNGFIHVHAAAERKEELHQQMRAGPIAHLAEVGRAAAREEHELGKTFVFRPGASTHFAFLTAARSMALAGQENRELLTRYGLSQSVLDEFVQMIDQFEAAMVLGHEGRTAHVGATREVRALGTEIVRAVRVMDARNRQRFAQDEQLLGSWISASTILGTPRPSPESEGDTPGGGEVKPAA